MSLKRLLLALTLCGSMAAHAQFTVTVLNPAGSGSALIFGVSGNTQIGTYTGQNPAGNHAVRWGGTGESAIDLNPSGSKVNAISGSVIVGVGHSATFNLNHPFAWIGSSIDPVDIEPTPLREGEAFAISGAAVVGIGTSADNLHVHARLWNLDTSQSVDLNPIASNDSYAFGVWGNTQVGSLGRYPIDSQACLWHGSPDSIVLLNPDGFTVSNARGVWEDTQVGFAQNADLIDHAALWKGSASSFVDLNPSGYLGSQAKAVYGYFQVGYADSSPMIWNGSADRAIDLLPTLANLTFAGQPISVSYALATSLDEQGHIGGYAVDANSNKYALLWTSTEAIQGTGSLQNLVSGAVAGQPLSFEIRLPGSLTVVDRRTLPSGANGQFAFYTFLQAESYDVALKGSHWLRKRLGNQTLTTSGLSGLSFSLVNGDVNGDNVVSLGDLGQLRAAFGSAAGDSNWNPNADLNGDGVVSLADLGILRSNFGQQGDP